MQTASPPQAVPAGTDSVRSPRLARRRRHRRVVAVLAVLVVLVVAAGFTTLSVGDLQVSFVDVVRVLLGHGTGLTDYLVLGRLPRVVLSIIAGASLALSGALFQSLLRNSLASPDILGVTGGASVATVVGSLILEWDGLARSGLAAGGALLVAAIIAALAWDHGISGNRVVLVGIGVSFMVTAVLGYVLTRADVLQAQVALSALVGGVGNADWPTDTIGGVGLAVLVAITLPAARSLRALQLGDDTARALGVAVGPQRALLFTLAVLFAAVGVACAGPLAFVAFMSAPIARRLLRDGSPALLASALVGVLVVQVADLVGHNYVPGGAELPAGVMTGVIGAPYLLWLLATGARTSSGDSS